MVDNTLSDGVVDDKLSDGVLVDGILSDGVLVDDTLSDGVLVDDTLYDDTSLDSGLVLDVTCNMILLVSVPIVLYEVIGGLLVIIDLSMIAKLEFSKSINNKFLPVVDDTELDAILIPEVVIITLHVIEYELTNFSSN